MVKLSYSSPGPSGMRCGLSTTVEREPKSFISPFVWFALMHMNRINTKNIIRKRTAMVVSSIIRAESCSGCYANMA